MPSSSARYTDTNTAASANVSFFETSVGNWTAGDQASAVIQSTDQAHEGTHTLKATRSATSPGTYTAVCGTTDFPVVASTDYVLDYWVWASVGSAIFKIDIDWYTSGQVFISTSTGTQFTGANSDWTHCGPVTVTSAATAAFARPAFVNVSGLATGDTVYLDEAQIFRRIWKHQLPVFQTPARAAVR